jgi:nicotinate-nucleotide adenylyltransferase
VAVSDKFSVNRIEAERSALSYSIDTLRELQRRVTEPKNFFLILGGDAFAAIDTWKEFTMLVDNAHLVIISRPDTRAEIITSVIRKFFPDYAPGPDSSTWTSEKQTGDIILLSMQPVEISSTMIRDNVRQGRDVTGLVPPGVADYIRLKKLYSA